MKNIWHVIIVIVLLLLLLFFITNPDIVKNIWLWLIGLIGPIIAGIRTLGQGISNLFKEDGKSSNSDNRRYLDTEIASANQKSSTDAVANNKAARINEEESNKRIVELEKEITKLQRQLSRENKQDGFAGATLTVLRYFDDGETTLGLLFYEDDFFCYTLEDTYREVKIMKETRIPEGIYTVGFNRADTDLTKKYRKTRPWFNYHLHVKNVPNYSGVYIHVGNTIADTAGCLLVADSITSNSSKKTIYNSKVTFKKLYLKLKPLIDEGKPVRIKYYDEDWFKRFKLKRIVA